MIYSFRSGSYFRFRQVVWLRFGELGGRAEFEIFLDILEESGKGYRVILRKSRLIAEGPLAEELPEVQAAQELTLQADGRGCSLLLPLPSEELVAGLRWIEDLEYSVAQLGEGAAFVVGVGTRDGHQEESNFTLDLERRVQTRSLRLVTTPEWTSVTELDLLERGTFQ